MHRLSSHPLDKAKFLEIIEKDHPGHWLCHICTVLHPRPYNILDYNGHASYERTHRTLPMCIQTCGVFGEAWYPLFSPILSITHPMIHVAMNRHLFAPSHSDSLDVFFKPLEKDEINKVNISTRACISEQVLPAMATSNCGPSFWEYRLCLQGYFWCTYLSPFTALRK